MPDLATSANPMTFTDPITQLAARDLKGPQKDVFQAQMQTSKEAEPLLDQKANAQAQVAGDQIASAENVQQQVGALNQQIQPFEAFKPTPENKDNLLRLFALTAATTFLGGGSRQSGVNAMTNLSSAVQGYGQGREDLYQHELTQYQENMKRTQEQNASVRDQINQVLQLWSVDREKAQQKLTQLAATTDSALIKNAAKTANLDKLQQALENQRKADMQYQALHAKLFGDPNAELPQDTIEAMAAQARAGDRTVFQNLGRGAQGSKNIVRIREAMTRQYQAKGVSPAEAGKLAATATAEFEGLKAGERALGTRTAQADMAVSEFQKILPIAVQASQAVPRGSFVPANKALQAFQSNTGDPKIRAFGAAVNTLVNTYARAISPQGGGTVSDKEHARELLSTADSPEQFEAITNILQQEALAAQASPRTVKQDMRENFTGQKPAEERKPMRTGTEPTTGRKVVQYSDGSVEYAD